MPSPSRTCEHVAVSQRVIAWLSHRHASVGIVALALLLTLPTLSVGLHTDDYLQRAVLIGSPLVRPYFPTAMSMFEFLDGDPGRTARMMDRGSLPWWTVPEIKASFWRPLAVATHWLDYRLWPNTPALMHAQSLLWFAALVAAAACLYRRVMGLTWIAGLAALMYAVDDAHATPAAWLANRNIVLAAFFGVCSLLAHDRWRRGGGPAAALLAPALLAGSLLAAEAGLSTVAYLVAYAIFLDRGRWRSRLATRGPYICVAIAWRAAWAVLGHGALHVGYYIDPLHEPMRFLIALVHRAPILLLGQWALPPADLTLFFGPVGQRVYFWVAVGFVVLLAILLAQVVRRSAAARFWAAGMLLSLPPVCATFPSDRLLFFVGLGAMGLLAEFLAAVFDRSFQQTPGLFAPRVATMFAVALLVIHLVIAPPALVVRGLFPLGPEWLHPETCLGVSLDHAVERQDVCMINSPMPSFALHFLINQELAGQPVPRRARVLSPTTGPLTVARPDPRTLVVRSVGPGGFNVLERLFRCKRDPMKIGDRVELSGLSIEVTRVDADGLPIDAVFRFVVPLEDTSLRWLYSKDGRLRPWTPPAVGETVELAAAFELSLHRL